MPRRMLDRDVFSEAVSRMQVLYEAGHRIIISFSAGKDSGVCLEICRIAAREAGRLPLEVVMRDEEIMFPGTFEYAERTAADPEVNFHWLVAGQPIINSFNRKMPYFWVFDNRLAPEQWVRQPPSYAERIPDQNIEAIVSLKRFPPEEGKNLYTVIGLRVSESINRRLGLFSSKGYITGFSRGVSKLRPIYDWTDADVWKAVSDNQWDYNHAYDAMVRFGVNKRNMRIAPPTLTPAGIDLLGFASRAWPTWFERVTNRLDGVRTAAQFGKRSVEPMRRTGELWSDTFRRECVSEAPKWIGKRAFAIAEIVKGEHGRHSTSDLPEIAMCAKCKLLGSWRRLALATYMGDPFSLKQTRLPALEPEFFREGAGTWGGSPTWK